MRINIEKGSMYNRWTILDEAPKRGDSRYVFAKCECGTEKEVNLHSILRGTSVSCGCFKNEVQRARLLKHGHTSNNPKKITRLYKIYHGIKTRCYNPKSQYWEYYGAKNITMCDLWKDNYTSFVEWAESTGYSDSLTIDRKDDTLGYSPENCRWVTPQIQAANRPLFKNNKSGYTGVLAINNRWKAVLDIDRKTHYIGTFDTPEEAAQARDCFIEENNLVGYRKAIN